MTDTIQSEAHPRARDVSQLAADVAHSGSLFDRLGGTYGIAGAVDILVDRLFANVAVNANEKVHAHHGNPANAPGYKFLVTGWSIEAAGGPKCYPGHDMVAAHEHLGIDTAGFNAVYKEIAATLNFLDVPEREHEEFMALIEKYRPEVIDGVRADPQPAGI